MKNLLFVTLLTLIFILGACGKKEEVIQPTEPKVETTLEAKSEEVPKEETPAERQERELGEKWDEFVAQKREENKVKMIDMFQLPLAQVNTSKGTLTKFDTTERLAIVGKVNELTKSFKLISKSKTSVSSMDKQSENRFRIMTRNDVTREDLFIYSAIDFEYFPDKEKPIQVIEHDNGNETYYYYEYDANLAKDLLDYINSMGVDVPFGK